MAKFKVGQLVIVKHPKYRNEMRGAVGEILALPGENYPGIDRSKKGADHLNGYLVCFPGYTNTLYGDIWTPKEYQLDNINDSDNLTAENENNLVFSPSKEMLQNI